MKKIVVVMMILLSIANAGRLEIVDEMMRQGADEVFKKSWKTGLKNVEKRIDKSKLTDKQKIEEKDRITNMGNDPIFIREMIKATIENATKDMSKEEIEYFTKIVKNESIKKITKMVTEKKLLWKKGKKEKEEEENFYGAVEKELSKEEFEEYKAIIENRLYTDTLIKFYSNNHKLDENMEEIIGDAIRGERRIIIEMRDE